jgi:DNA invertase Pin-like site-specific DNA recombinase
MRLYSWPWPCQNLGQGETRCERQSTRGSAANHGQDIHLQTRELQQFCKARGWEIAGEYLDEGISGAKSSRPELNRLMADADKHKFEAVVVWRFDRFPRSTSHLLRALETFKSLGIDFVSFSEQLDTTTSAGKMIFTIFGAFAEFERNLIVERVNAGLRNAKAKGVQLGRPRKRVDVKAIAALQAQGLSLPTIAKQLGVPVSSAYAAMKRAA